MIATAATLAIPIWLAVLVLTLLLLFAAWPEHVRPRLVRWRKRRRNVKRIQFAQRAFTGALTPNEIRAMWGLGPDPFPPREEPS